MRFVSNRRLLQATLAGLVIGACILTVLNFRAAILTSLASIFNVAVSDRGVVIETDLAYGPMTRQKLDIYRPAGATRPTAIVLFIYGGSWRTGDRALYRFVGSALAKRGFLAIVPDYRLFPEARFPEFISDVAEAYAWGARLPGNRDIPIFVAGHSAGAHIAALLTYDSRYRDRIDPALPKPRGFIGLAGPYAFDPKTNASTAEIFATAVDANDARPVAYARGGQAPALLIHGLDDTTVGVWNTRAFAEALTSRGVGAETIELPGFGHIGLVLAIARPFRWRGPVLDKISAFVTTTAAAKVY